MSQPLTDLQRRLEKLKAISPGPIKHVIAPLTTSARGLVLAGLAAQADDLLVAILPAEKEVPLLIRDYHFFAKFIGLKKKAVTIPAFYSEEKKFVFSDSSRQAQLIKALYCLSDNPQQTVCILSSEALAQKVIDQEDLISRLIEIKKDDSLDRELLIEHLQDNGYQKSDAVEHKGEFAVRGGTVDIFSPQFDNPLRLILFGETVESLRFFSATSQLSLKEIEGTTIIPLTQVLLTEQALKVAKSRLKELADEQDIPLLKRRALEETISEPLFFSAIDQYLVAFNRQLRSLFSYFSKDSLLLTFEETTRENFKELSKKRLSKEKELAKEREEIFFPEKERLLTADELFANKDKFKQIAIESLALESKEKKYFDLGIKAINGIDRQKLKAKEQSLKEIANLFLPLPVNKKIISFAQSLQQQRFDKLLPALNKFKNQSLLPEQLLNKTLTKEQFSYQGGQLSGSFYLAADDIAFISDKDIFASNLELRRKPSPQIDEALFSLSDFAEGDFVVHVEHGIAIYSGLKRMTIDKRENDFCLLQFAGKDKIFLPVDRLNLLQKYIASGGKPKLDSLGSGRFEKAKGKARQVAEQMAEELIALYAKRQVAQGHSFSPPEETFTRFAADFPFRETTDQTAAIEAVIEDMQASRPMDRLVCGDVGFGKTEVAIRAAMLAVLDGKQVALLVPTTVLAQQHYNTFKNRFQGYPLNIASLSRFLNSKEQKQVLEQLKKGRLDIIIATHRLLSNDVEFNNLGLLILDEEQRFGVKAKEKIKQFKHNIDVLTLSATPIPRTLQMSILAIRDLSLISTPPADRQAIKTAVARFDPGLIADAIRREMARAGQIFFVHNRVQSMPTIATFLQKLVPEMKIAIAHGQLQAKELEKVMLNFLEKKSDLLLTTAIIESGLDIPNANTLIVNRADQFGLAQLYQLRGRVGRSFQNAFAYLLIPEKENLSNDAKKRLAALREFTALGSGFRIALHDLEIRGAGNLLGHKQSGQISEVGLELYCKLLDKAVRQAKGEKLTETIEPLLSLPIPAYIPSSYLPESKMRLILYKRLSGLSEQQKLTELEKEIIDRFGPMPKTVANLLKIISLKIVAKRALVEKLEMDQQSFSLLFSPQAKLKTKQLIGWIESKKRGSVQLEPNGRLVVKRRVTDDLEQLESIKKILHDFCLHG